MQSGRASNISPTARLSTAVPRRESRTRGHGMNLRMLLAVTLLASISFHLSASTTGQHPASPNDSHKPQLDVSSLRQQVRDGDAKAQYKLGLSYMTGSGVTRDYEKALDLYNKAAKQGSTDAEFGLGYMYEQGWGVKKDYGQAFLYYSSAARQGHPTAENNLGSMYERGE